MNLFQNIYRTPTICDVLSFHTETLKWFLWLQEVFNLMIQFLTQTFVENACIIDWFKMYVCWKMINDFSCYCTLRKIPSYINPWLFFSKKVFWFCFIETSPLTKSDICSIFFISQGDLMTLILHKALRSNCPFQIKKLRL